MIYVPAQGLSPRAGLHNEATIREDATKKHYWKALRMMLYEDELRGGATGMSTSWNYKNTLPKRWYEDDLRGLTIRIPLCCTQEQGSTRYIRRAPTHLR